MGFDQKAFESARKLWFEEWDAILNREQLLILADKLMKEGKYEESVTAIYILIRLQKDNVPNLMITAGDWLEKNIINWAQTDFLCGEVISSILIKQPLLIKELEGWRKSESKWRRRAVPVSLIIVMKNGIDPELLLEIIDPMMIDKVREVHQGLGWFLRETWKKYPAQTEKFMLKWKNSCARLIIQYATEKME